MSTEIQQRVASQVDAWPRLPLKEWEATRDTLHMWMQIVGKVRLALSPYVNHCWHVPLYVTARGLTTSPMPHERGIFEIQFDFVNHVLIIQTDSGTVQVLRLRPQCVADFYAEFMLALRSVGLGVKIWPMPVEIPNPMRFEQDRVHCSYDPEYANRFWRVLLSADSVLKEFRGRFIGKHSPVHFFWGAMDMASTRFSGRRAPGRPEPQQFMRDAYSHEVMSVGFWPGSGPTDAVFYAYGAPEPAGFPEARVQPPQAFYSTEFKEFLLKYEDVRASSSPREMVLEFFQSSYEACALAGKWDRESLERTPAGQ
jgi:hypothetical protein